MPLRLEAVTYDAHDPVGLAAFWSALTAREVVPEDGATLLPGDDAQLGLRLVAAATEKSGPDRMHLHLTSTSGEDQKQTVETALDLGARHLDVRQLPDETHVLL